MSPLRCCSVYQLCLEVLLCLCGWWPLPTLWPKRPGPSWGRSFTLETLALWKRWDKFNKCKCYLLVPDEHVKRHIQTPPAVEINELFLLPLCVPAQTGANDLQTLADRLAQQSICASLSRRFPKITIIGEEVSRLEALFCVAVKLETFTPTPTQLF